MTKLASILFCALLACSSYAADRYFPAEGTLQTLIDASSPGDTVWIATGAYTTNITVGDGVIVQSQSGNPADTILDGGNLPVPGLRVVTQATNSWLVGLTIRNGFQEDMSGSDGGAGVLNGYVSNCVISGNSIGGAMANGGGLMGCTIYNSTVVSNTADTGGGMGLGGGGYNCIFYDSDIHHNTAEQSGGGGVSCTFVNTLVWHNSPPDVDNSMRLLIGGTPGTWGGAGGIFKGWVE